MGRIWPAALALSALAAVLTGRAGDAARALMDAGPAAVELMIALLGAMTLWSGLMEILQETGDVERLGRGLRRVMRPLCPGLTDDRCWEAMGLNLSANLLGLGNAATPAGVRAAELLSGQGEAGLRALATLLAINNSSLQLMPTTVMALRAQAGSVSPADIWPAALLSSGAATLAAAALMGLCQRRRRHG